MNLLDKKSFETFIEFILQTVNYYETERETLTMPFKFNREEIDFAAEKDFFKQPPQFNQHTESMERHINPLNRIRSKISSDTCVGLLKEIIDMTLISFHSSKSTQAIKNRGSDFFLQTLIQKIDEKMCIERLIQKLSQNSPSSLVDTLINFLMQNYEYLSLNLKLGQHLTKILEIDLEMYNSSKPLSLIEIKESKIYKIIEKKFLIHAELNFKM